MGDHEALKRALRAARSQAGIESDQELALKAGVHLQTIQNWMYGKTTPRPSELHKVAQALGQRMDMFMAAYEGRPVEPPPLQDAIKELVVELRLSRTQQHEATMALLRAVGALSGSVQGPRETPAGSQPEAAVGNHPGARS